MDEITKNKILIEKYPFLRTKYNDKEDYTFTELDFMPDGWRNAFGEQMCEELKEALGDEVDTYKIADIKEKWGQLCWYDYGVTKNKEHDVEEVIHKYEELSKTICIECGKPATNYFSSCPFCDDCYQEINDWYKRAVPRYKDNEEDENENE